MSILERDAVEVIDDLKGHAHAVIYCDPPYGGTLTKRYGAKAPLHEMLRAALLAQQGRVAVSGAGVEWDCLGWNRYEHRVNTGASVSVSSPDTRTEVLWTNYTAQSQGALL